MKACTRCSQDKALCDFPPAKGYRGGLASWCRACKSDYARQRYLSKREEIRVKQASYREANLAKVREQKRQCSMRYARRRGVKPRYYCASEEERRLGQVVSKRRYAERNREKVKASQRAYAARNPEKVKIAIINVKARYRGAPGELTTTQWKALLLFYGHRCAECGASAADRPLSVDHFIPVSAGGGNTWDNVWPLCVPCNVAKRATLPEAPAPPHVETFRKTGTFD